jgi:hypothetical protein
MEETNGGMASPGVNLGQIARSGGAITPLDDDLTIYVMGPACIMQNLIAEITVNPIARFAD